MPFSIEAETPPLKVWADGTIRIGQSRIKIERIIKAFVNGSSAEQFAHDYPTVTVEDAYGAIFYYLRHKATLDEHVAEMDRQGDEAERLIEEKFGSQQGMRERIIARREALADGRNGTYYAEPQPNEVA